MTGFARREIKPPWGTAVWKFARNHLYLDLDLEPSFALQEDFCEIKAAAARGQAQILAARQNGSQRYYATRTGGYKRAGY
jgi:hypothetical protein